MNGGMSVVTINAEAKSCCGIKEQIEENLYRNTILIAAKDQTYEIASEPELGVGSFASVYKCRNTKNGELRAMKIIDLDEAKGKTDPP